MFAVAFLFRAAQNAAQTTLAPLGEVDLHLGPAVVGLVIALASLVGVAATVILGRLVPTEQIRNWMTVGLLVLVGAFPLLGLAPDPAVFVAGALMLGAGGGLTQPSLTTLVAAGARASAGRVLAALTVVLSISLAVGPLIESMVLGASDGSLRVPLLAFAAFPLAAAVVSRHWHPRPGPVGVEVTAPAVVVSPGTASGRPFVAKGSPWRRPGWRLATAGQLLYQVPFTAIVVFGVIDARRVYGLSLSAAQLGLTAFFAASMVTRLGLTWQGQVARPRRVMLLAAGLTIAGVTALATGPDAGFFFAALVALGVPHGLTYPVGLALIADETPPMHLAHANAASSAWTSVVQVALPAALGALAGAVGLRGMFAAVLAPVVAMTAVIVGLTPDRPR